MDKPFYQHLRKVRTHLAFQANELDQKELQVELEKLIRAIIQFQLYLDDTGDSEFTDGYIDYLEDLILQLQSGNELNSYESQS